VNSQRNVEYRIVEVRSQNAAVIDPQAHPEAMADKLAKEFSNDTWFDVYDYGVGDEVVWPYVVSITPGNPTGYHVTAPVPVKVNLPGGERVRE
jgi:hypothetical protein